MYENQHGRVPSLGGAVSSYGANVASGGTTTTQWNSPTPPDVSVLDSVSRDVNNAADQLAELTSRARSIADAVFGSAPEAKEGIGGVSPTSGRIEALGRANSNLFAVIAALRVQIDRLTCL